MSPGTAPDHELWHDWAVFHTLIGLLFTVFGAIHVRDHWGWYRGLWAKGPKGRSRIVSALSAVCVPLLVTAVLLLCCVDGANTPVGCAITPRDLPREFWGHCMC